MASYVTGARGDAQAARDAVEQHLLRVARRTRRRRRRWREGGRGGGQGTARFRSGGAERQTWSARDYLFPSLGRRRLEARLAMVVAGDRPARQEEGGRYRTWLAATHGELGGFGFYRGLLRCCVGLLMGEHEREPSLCAQRSHARRRASAARRHQPCDGAGIGSDNGVSYATPPVEAFDLGTTGTFVVEKHQSRGLLRLVGVSRTHPHRNPRKYFVLLAWLPVGSNPAI